MNKFYYCLSLSVVGAMLSYSIPAVALKHVSIPQHKASQSIVVLNTDNATKIALLKGLGEKRAQAVVNYRKKHGPFKSINELVKVNGVGSKLLARVIKNNAGQLRLN